MSLVDYEAVGQASAFWQDLSVGKAMRYRPGLVSGVLLGLWGVMVLACAGGGREEQTPNKSKPDVLLQNRRSEASSTPPELKGVWRHKSYDSFGKPENDPFHVSWEFLDGNRVKIVTPKYKAMPEQTMDQRIEFWPDRRFQVYNRVGTTRVNLFSGIWSLKDEELTLNFNTGDQFPSETTEPTEIEAKLIMSR